MKRMRFRRLVHVGLLLLLSAGVTLASRSARSVDWHALTPEDAAPNLLLVAFDPAKAPPPPPTSPTPFRTLQMHATLGATVRHEYQLIPWQVVEIPDSISLAQAAAAYAQDPAVVAVEPNYVLRLEQTIPNDPDFGQLWGLSRISAPQAWDVTTGSDAIVVAVIDTGIRYTHEDLADNMWENPNPTFGDVHGATFTSWTGTPTNGDPMDTHGHGTHVAGTIGAVGNNNIGVVGVNWQVRLMALKFLDPTGATADAVAALEYAILNGAHVSNNSWGGGGYSMALAAMIDQARAANQLFITSAGNDTNNNDAFPVYPANYAYDNVISVASIQVSGALSSFSNYGRNTVHIAAPGSDIRSAWATSDSAYVSISGTSMASPHVAGVAALLLAIRPTASYTQVRDAILNGAVPSGLLEDRVATDGELDAVQAMGQLAGSLTLDRLAYRSDAPVLITVDDIMVPETDFSVTVEWRTTDSNDLVRAQDTFELFREPDPAFRFTGILQLMTGVNAEHGDTLTVEYEHLDALSNTVVAVVSTPIDDVPPEIRNARFQERIDDRLVVTWETDEDAIGGALAGQTLPPDTFDVSTAVYSLDHQATFSGLDPLSRYYVAIWAEDPAGNRTEIPPGLDSLNPADYLTDVTRGRVHVYETDFERGTAGWTAQSLYGPECWAHGLPKFGPQSASRCWGTRISDRYPAAVNAVLVAPRVKVGDYPQIHFRHWFETLNRSAYEDGGMVEVFLDGVWHNVTRYADGSFGRDVFKGNSFGWRTERIRLPVEFANRTLQVRFRFLSAAGSGTSNPAGWFIDDFAVSEVRLDGLLITDVAVDDSPPGGDGDGFAEPGETISLTLEVFNLEDIALTNLVGSLTLLSAGQPAVQAAMPNGSPALIEYGTVAAGDPAVGLPAAGLPIEVVLAPDFDPDADLVLFQTLTDSEGRQFETRHRLPIQRRETIAGFVFDSTNAPVEAAQITAQYGSEMHYAQTGPDGAFAIQGASPDRLYDVTAHPPGTHPPMTRRTYAPETNLVFRLGGQAMPELLPDFIWWTLQQGESASDDIIISNVDGTEPFFYRIETAYWGGSDGWLDMEPLSGKVPAGDQQILSLSVDTAFLHSGIYDAYLSVIEEGPGGQVRQATVWLDVLERPLLAFESVRIDSPNGRIMAGEPTDVWITLRNTNAWSDAIGLLGIVTNTTQATVEPPGETAWSFIPSDGSAEADQPITVTLDPGLADGDVATITLEVFDLFGDMTPITFSLQNHAYTLSGQVTCSFLPDDNGLPLPYTEPVSNALVTVTDRNGAVVGSALSDTNGVYQITALGGEPLWAAVTPPEAHPRMVPPAGQALQLTGDTVLDFELRQDGGDPPDHHAPRLILHDLTVINLSDEPDTPPRPGDRLELRAYLRNIGVTSATSVTGLLEAADMGIADVMTVFQGAASDPRQVTAETSPLFPVLLTPVFEVDVDPLAPRGAVQRFVLHAVDAGSEPPRHWPLEFTVQVDSRIALSGSINFEIPADNTIANFRQTRLRLRMGAFDRTLGVEDDGSFRFVDVPRDVAGTLAIVDAPNGYALSTMPVAPMTDDVELLPVTINRATLDFPVMIPEDLAFTLAEGHSATGQLSVANTGSEAMTLRPVLQYRRTLDEVQAPEPGAFSMMTSDADGERPPLDWEAVEPESHQADEVVVRFAAGVGRDEQKAILAAQGLEVVFHFNSFPAALARRLEGPAPLSTLASLAATLEDDDRVTQVAPDARAEPMTATLPNDRLFDQLWGLRNRRQTGGTLGADIRAPQAWSWTTGSRDIVVAVVDSGMAIEHPDLAANLWRNPYPGTSADIENDWHGWNFFDWNNDVADLLGHGTHVAGTIGAVGDNTTGVVGVNWSVSLMPLRLSGDTGNFTTSARIAKAIEYAVENGAHISNHSWGGPDTAGVIHDAIAFARDHNHLVIAAAGNSAQNLDDIKTYPAYYSTVFENVITVAASDHDGELAYFSNFGSDSVQLAAPGVAVLSTVPPHYGNYDFKSGTSMAAPHVAGVAALLWSLAPDAPYTVIREAILQGARPDPNLDNWVEKAAHLDAWGAIRAIGMDWLQLSTRDPFVLGPGQTTNLVVTVNDPPQLVSRTLPYEADIVFHETSGAFTRTVPVSVDVQPGNWMTVPDWRLENLEAHDDGLAPGPGDTVELWVSLKNLGAATAGNLTGTLNGGAGSVIQIATNSWRDLFGGQTAEARNAFRVTLDPGATGDLTFVLDVDRDGVPVGPFTVTLPVLMGRNVTGRVLSMPEGEPVSQARVEVWGDQGADGRTRTDGTFLLRGLPDGDYRLRVVPVAHERLAPLDFAIAGLDLDLGDLAVAAPQVAAEPDALHLGVLQGQTTSSTLTLTNLPGTGNAPFDYTLTIAPRRRVALVSDGDTLQPLQAPLRAMGFEVAGFTNNFDRVQQFQPVGNAYWLEQAVTYTDDPVFLARFDAVIVDLTGPNGLGRVLSEAEREAFQDFAQRGGRVIFTGANPLSLPDNEGLANLVGIGSLDRADEPAGQADALAAAWVNSPFLTLEDGQRLKTTHWLHDRADVDIDALPEPLFAADGANKLVYRALSGGGALYVWTGNPADADWAEPGLWQDVLRGILWRELIEDSAHEVDWLDVSQDQGSLAVGAAQTLTLTANAAWPVGSGAYEAVLLVFGNGAGADIRAIPVDMTVQSPALRAYTTGRVTDWRGQWLRGDGGPQSALFQVIWAGPDGVINPPSLDGSPTGDDVLLGVYATGSPVGRFGVGFETAPDSGRFDQAFRQRIPVSALETNVYVRAWDGASFESSLAYGDSALQAIDPAQAAERDFGSWSVTNVLRYGRDANGDSIPDGWLIANNPDVDPRAPVAPLPFRADFAGKTTVQQPGQTRTPPHQVVVAESLIFVLDRQYARIAVLDRETHAFLHYFGQSGDADGEFRLPQGLALDPRPGINRLVVADTNRDRVQILAFDPVTGAITWQQTIGNGRGNAPNQFDRPAGVAVMPVTGDIFVADTVNNRVQILDADGAFLGRFSGSGDFLMHRPQGIAVDYDLGVFVADTGENRILRFTHGGTPVLKFGANGSDDGQFAEPVDIRIWRQTRPAAVGGGTVRRLAVTDRLNERVQLFLPDGTHLGNVGATTGSGSEDGRLGAPYGAFPVPDSRRIYVADTGNQRLQWFDVWLDADGDGMDDFWEDWNGLDSTVDDAFEDPDNDGLLNIGEFRANTNPLDPDTNDNGVGDLWSLYQDGFPDGPALLVALTADPQVVNAGDAVLLTATFDRALPADADVWLTLAGASPLAARRMQTADGTNFLYSHTTLLGQDGWADAELLCGYVDPAVTTSNNLFRVEDAATPMDPFPIGSLSIGGSPLQVTVGWEAVVGGEYRILRSQDLTLPFQDWDVVWTGFATSDPMTQTLPLDLPYAYYVVQRLQ